MAGLKDIVEFVDGYLEIDRFDDYCPNGLQVAGKADVKKILAGVSASQALLDGAVERGADMILVHHGYFWKGESQSITGLKYEKIKTLLQNDISLVAYHLPLDAHITCGNNAKLAELLGVEIESWIGPGKVPIIAVGHLQKPLAISEFVVCIQGGLNRKPLHVGADSTKEIYKVAICTGGAQNYFSYAIAHGVDVFITGEISEQHYHMAMESGVDFISAGHHATERYGVQALSEIICERFSIDAEYLEIPNPV